MLGSIVLTHYPIAIAYILSIAKKYLPLDLLEYYDLGYKVQFECSNSGTRYTPQWKESNTSVVNIEFLGSCVSIN